MARGRVSVEFNRPLEAKGLLSTTEMCQEWNCHPPELTTWAKDGMPRKKFGDAYFYDLKECQEWYATSGTPRWDKPTEAKNLLTFNQLCLIWHCSRNVIQRNIARGLPAHKIGSKYYFNLDECQKWMEGEKGEGKSRTKAR